jgi:uncharacterized membrane protein YphA (DoxX/SURF4 family)
MFLYVAARGSGRWSVDAALTAGAEPRRAFAPNA